MINTIGARLPSPYYEMVHDKVIVRVVHRQCRECDYPWTSCEVPLSYQWDGTKVECCPVHHEPGSAITTIDRDRALKGKMESPGLLRVMALGGVYRRRECIICVDCGHTKGRHKAEGCYRMTNFTAKIYKLEPGDFLCPCKEFKPCMYKERRARWSTGEFSSDGLVVADITRCPRCDAKGPIIPRSQRQLSVRGQVAKGLAAKRG